MKRTKPNVVRKPSAVSGRSFFRPREEGVVPRDLIQACLRDEYLIGRCFDPSYKYIGLSLALSGIYEYWTLTPTETESPESPWRFTHYGFCRVELRNNELQFAGVRLWSNLNVDWSGDIAGQLHPLYWRSVLSYYRPFEKRDALYFIYRLYTSAWKQGDGCERIKDFWKGKSSVPSKLATLEDVPAVELKNLSDHSQTVDDRVCGEGLKILRRSAEATFSDRPMKLLRRPKDMLAHFDELERCATRLQPENDPPNPFAYLDMYVEPVLNHPDRPIMADFRTLAPQSVAACNFFKRVAAKGI